MSVDLDEAMRVAVAARDSFCGESPNWYNGGWSEHAVSPEEVIALVRVAQAASDLVNDYRSESPDGGATMFVLCKAVDALRGER